MKRLTLPFLCLSLLSSAARADFTDDERAAVVAFWSDPARYEVGFPEDAARRGFWQVRLTPEGSVWLQNYARVKSGPGKLPPNADPTASSAAGTRRWDEWVNARVAYDRWLAEGQVRRNQAAMAAALAPPPVPEAGPAPGTEPPAAPPLPGPIPGDLMTQIGTPPPFAAAVQPMRHLVRFPDGEVALLDNPNLPPRYAFYRFSQGVMSGGTPVSRLNQDGLRRLMERAGIPSAHLKVMGAISAMEGGFDSVNTYDTGFVSVGFLQFASLSGGSGALGSVMLRMKQDDPAGFQKDFRNYGLDVNDSAVIEVCDPLTGAFSQGPDAVMRIVNDRRLIAVFARAGRLSAGFRIAQLKVAFNGFFPAEDSISLVGNRGPMFGKMRDVFRSEAGLATLMDRKVNTGNLRAVVDVANRIARMRDVNSLEELSKFEREIVQAVRWRKDFLADRTLSQPPAIPANAKRIDPPPPSRHGTRSGRRGTGGRTGGQ